MSRSKNVLPRDPKDWADWAEELHGAVDPFALSLDDVPKMNSASKLDEKSFILLRVLCSKADRMPTHDDIFGPQLGDSMKVESQTFLKSAGLWDPLLRNEENLISWGFMAPWKRSVQSIKQRGLINGLKEPDVDALDNPFKIYVEPGLSARSAKAEGVKKRQETERRMDEFENASVGSSASADHVKDFGSPSSARSVGSRPSNTGSQRTGSPSAISGVVGHSKNFRGSPERITPSGSPGSSIGSADSIEGRLLARRPPDEALINMSLVLFLQGISMLHPKIGNDYDWTPLHKAFRVSQSEFDPQRRQDVQRTIMTARPDGCLQRTSEKQLPEEGRTLSIVEVKPFRRFSTLEKAIRMQEGAQMAAWISSECMYGLLPELTTGTTLRRRVMISQDLDEIYITVASFDDEYVRYISKGTRDAAANYSTQSTPTKPPASREQHQQPLKPAGPKPTQHSPVPPKPSPPVFTSTQLPHRPGPTPSTSSKHSSRERDAAGRFKSKSESTKPIAPPIPAQATSIATTTSKPSGKSTHGDVFGTNTLTPVKPRRVTPPPPGAPDVNAGKSGAIPQDNTTRGFLTMTQYKACKVGDENFPSIARLLLSITIWLAAQDAKSTGQHMWEKNTPKK